MVGDNDGDHVATIPDRRPKAKQESRPTFQLEDSDAIKRRISVTLADSLSWFFLMIPGPVRRYIALRLGSLSYRLSHGYRQNVEANIRVVTGETSNSAEVRDLTRSIFINNAFNFMDLLIMPRRSSNFLIRQADVVQGSWENVQLAADRGKGVIFVSAHVGCFDFFGQALAAVGFPVTVVTGRTTSRFIFDGVKHLRSHRGNKMVEPTPSGVRTVIKRLRAGKYAAFVADRDFFQNGEKVVFFGEPTTLPPGPVRIARDTGAAIIPIFTRRTRKGHQIRIYPAMYIEKTSDTKADVKRGLDRLVPILEEGISGGLEQWAMFQRTWPDHPVSAIRIFPEGSPLESELLEKVVQRLPEKRSWEDV